LRWNPPVSTLVVVDPEIEIKAIEGDALRSDWDHRQPWAHFSVEAVLIHSQISWRITESKQPGLDRPWI
jgi:hypothetical protein